MTVTQADKARQFRALHEAPDAIRCRECMGWRLGADDGGARVCGAGDFERRVGWYAGPA